MGLIISATPLHLLEHGENWEERWCYLPKDFADGRQSIWKCKLPDDEVYVVTFQKRGATWMQEAVWLLMNNLDFDKAKGLHLREHTPFLNLIDQLGSSPRDSTTVNLLPKEIWAKKPKIIYIAFNMQNILVSSCHFLNSLGWSFVRDLNQFVKDSLYYYRCIEPYDSYTCIADFWKLRHEPNICFLTYDDMKRDLGGVLQKLCELLDRPKLTPEELKAAVEHLAVDDFQFLNCGEEGADDLTPENVKGISDFSQAFFAKHGIQEEDIFGSV